MYIQDKELVIRSAVPSDAKQLTDWWNDGTVMVHAGFPNGLGTTVERTLSQIAENETARGQRCVIEADGVQVGEMNYSFIDEKTAEIGIKICDPAYQNGGRGSRYLRMLIDYLFDAERVEKVVLDTNLKNTRAQHVYEKLGFKKLRVNHHSWQDQLGDWQDSVDYEMTRLDRYRPLFKAEYLMGPNSARLLFELFISQPLELPPDANLLDLGCGKGLTSLIVAKETGATVYATDLWISEEENRERFAGWGMAGKLISVNADANDLPYGEKMFDGMVSVDAYHYFAGKEGFFTEKILPLMKSGGTVLIAVPGMQDAYDGQSEALTKDWLGDEAYMFQSPTFWKRIIGEHPRIESVESWEMVSFEAAWQEWFDTGHEFAMGDLIHYETIIKPYTAFVGIKVKIK